MTLQGIKAELAAITALLTGASTKDQISAVTLRVATLEGATVAELEAKDKTIATRDASLVTANATITELNTTATAKALEITNLTAEVAKEKKRANETLAAQGVAPEQVPASGAAELPGTVAETAFAKYERLRDTNPREAGAFWATDAQKILQSRPK